MNYIVIIIGFIIESFIMYHYVFSTLEKRFSKKLTLVIYIIAQIINSIKSLLLLNNLPLKAFTAQIYMILMVLLLTEGKLLHKLVVYTFYTISTLLAEITGTLIAKYVYGNDLDKYLEFSLECFIWQGTVYFFIFVYTTISLLLLKKRKISANTENFTFICLYMLLQSYIVFLFLVLAIKYGNTSSLTFFTLIFVMILSIIVAFFVYRETKLAAQKNAEAEFISKQTEIKDKHFLEIKEQFTDYRRLRHDFYNHIKIIDGLKDPEKLKEYINSMKLKFDKMDRMSYCNNLTLDALLSLKYSEALQKGIKASFEICNIEDIKITDFDLCSVISNLIDNGIEAAVKTQERSIALNLNKKMDRIIIVMKNASPEVSSDLSSTKSDK